LGCARRFLEDEGGVNWKLLPCGTGNQSVEFNQASSAFLAYRSIFFRMQTPAGGLISLFSHKVHCFFGELCGQERGGKIQEPENDVWG
jgi:hypothetical protein